MDDVAEVVGKYFSLEEMRDAFMARLHELVPRCFSTLMEPEGLVLAETQSDALMLAHQSKALARAYFEASQATRAYIERWQQRWELIAMPPSTSKRKLNVTSRRTLIEKQRLRNRGVTEFSWITDIAEATLRYTAINAQYGEPGPTSFVRRSPVRSRELVLASDLKIDLKGTSLSLPHLAWNPQNESRAEAKVRLSLHLDDALDTVESLYPVWKIPLAHLSWLIMFQVKQLSQNTIAERESRNRETVTKAVNNVAGLIGLEPRDGRKMGGRPAHSRARTIKL